MFSWPPSWILIFRYLFCQKHNLRRLAILLEVFHIEIRRLFMSYALYKKFNMAAAAILDCEIRV